MSKKKIIIAEDSSVIQNLTKKILLQLDYHITSVKNGQEVIDLLSNKTYDLILLDIYMPIMDGMECAKNIRAMDGDKKNVPIIAITGNADNYSEQDFKSVGINAFITKPLNYDWLVEQVKRFTNDN